MLIPTSAGEQVKNAMLLAPEELAECKAYKPLA